MSKKKTYLHRVSTLSAGTAGAQVLLLAAAPFITRVYTTESFGQFAAFAATVAVLSSVACLRLESAIPLEVSDQAAAGTHTTALRILLGFSFVSLLCTLAAGQLLPSPLGYSWTFLTVMIPLGILAAALFQLRVAGLLRRRMYRAMATALLVQGGAVALVQVGLGALFARSESLVAGLIAGYVLGLLVTYTGGRRAGILHQTARGTMRQVLRRNQQFLFFQAPATLLNQGNLALPVLLVASMFGPSTAGIFALTQRAVAVPLQVLGGAASQAFLGEAAASTREEAVALFGRAMAVAILAGSLAVIPLLMLGELLFAFVFGTTWKESGVIAALLAPLIFARFVGNTIAPTLALTGTQRWHLVWEMGRTLLILGTFISAHGLGWAIYSTIAAFSLGSAGMYLCFTGIAAWAIHQWSKGDASEA